MISVFDKLNLKDQTHILVLNPPDSFESELAALTGVTILRSARDAKQVTSALVFVTTLEEVEVNSKAVAQKLDGDALLWFAYPKGTSKRYTCDFNRDSGWDALGRAGFERVRQVVIDEDWSAMRFRRVEFIKTMKRRKSFAMTKQGKEKTRR